VKSTHVPAAAVSTATAAVSTSTTPTMRMGRNRYRERGEQHDCDGLEAAENGSIVHGLTSQHI
jgi:hypothetical protein